MGSQGTIDLGPDEPPAASLPPADLEERAVETTEEAVRQLDADTRRRVTRLLRDPNPERTGIVMMLLVEVCPRCHCADFYDVRSRDGAAKRQCVSCKLVYLPPADEGMESDQQAEAS